MSIGIGYGALSGMQAAKTAIDGVSHNISNLETPGFHRVETIFTERGPFPLVAGVDAKNVRTENDLLDNLMQSAALNKQNADTLAEAVGALNSLPSETLETSYSKLMESTHLLLRTPNDVVAQQDFNNKTVAFQDSLNAYQNQLESIKGEMNLRIDLGSQRIESLRREMEMMAKNGTTNQDDIYAIQMQLLQATGSLDAYRKILSDIIPPIEFAFYTAKETVQESMNQLSGQIIFNDTESVNKITDFRTFNEVNLPEWDSHWFNTEMGRIKTMIGNQQQLADNRAVIAGNAFDDASSRYHAAFGVDVTEEYVKMMNYQRMYEANALVIKAQDEMIGTLLSVVA